MAFERIDGRGVLFKNTRKTDEKHSDLQGDTLLNGTEYWINGWTKRDKNGNKYISLSFKPKSYTKTPSRQRQDDDLIADHGDREEDFF